MMDEILSQLDVSPNADLDQVTKDFALLLSFLQIEPYLEPDANEVRSFLRAALFLQGNLDVHGENLEKKLKEHQHIPKNELSNILTKFYDGSLLDDVCRKLLLTRTGPDHIFEIESFCNDFLDPSRYLAILQKIQNKRPELITYDIAQEAKFLVNTIFQLKSTCDIIPSIKRLIDTVSFEILAWIINYNEPHTYFYMKCCIIQKEISSDLEKGSISRNFIASMYEISCQDDDGLRAYMKCLQNKVFANSLMVFFMGYLKCMENNNNDNSQWNKCDLLHVSFLIAAMLSQKSECRIEFQKMLASTSVSSNVLLSISHLNFVYSF